MIRLYNAICGWLEADAQARTSVEEDHPTGDNFTQVEHAPGSNRQDLHADAHRESIDDDNGAVYRLGFNNEHKAIQDRMHLTDFWRKLP